MKPSFAPAKRAGPPEGLTNQLLFHLRQQPLALPILYMLLGGTIVYMLGGSGGSGPHTSATSSSMPDTGPPRLKRFALRPTAAAPTVAAVSGGGKQPGGGPPEHPAICKNSCFKAKDGVCDDGRNLQQMTHEGAADVFCDLGTDCSDCGPWKGLQHTPAWRERAGPIATLRALNISVLLRRSAHEPRFFFAYTDPSHDIDVSAHIHHGGQVEAGISHIMYHALHGPCTAGDGLFLDVGANFGWFSVMTAAMGCRAFLEYNVARNQLSHLVEVRGAAVVAAASPPGNPNYTIVVPHRGVWGTAGIDGSNIDTDVGSTGNTTKIQVVGETLDGVLAGTRQRVTLLKADVEGYEPGVVAGAGQLLQEGRIDNIILEYSPMVQEKKSLESMSLLPTMLLKLIQSHGFTIGHIPHKDLGPGVGWSEPLSQLPQVTPTSLEFDLWDAKQVLHMGIGGWFKEPCPEMKALRLITDGLPERLHPKSFHSMITVNTNIWASRDPAYMPYLQGPPVGVIPAHTSLNSSWFIPAWSDLGMGGRSCSHLRESAEHEGMTTEQRASFLISHRCRCGEAAPCVQQEEVAEACAQAGNTPYPEDPQSGIP